MEERNIIKVRKLNNLKILIIKLLIWLKRDTINTSYLSLTNQLDTYEEEALVLSINNSSKANKLLLNTYFIFLMTTLIALYNITEMSYLKNSYIDLIFYNASIKTEYLIYYLPILIIVFHLFLIESLRLHHYKVMSFLKYKKSLDSNDVKPLLLYPFVFNNTMLYGLKVKNINFSLFISIILLLIFPILVIHSTLFYSEYPDFNIVYILIFAIVNIIYSILMFKKRFIVFMIAICYLYGIMYYDIKMNIERIKGYPVVFLKKDITPFSKNALYNKNTNFKDNNTKYISYSEGIEIKDRKLNILVLNQSIIANSLFINTYFNGLNSDQSKLINNQYINSDLNNFIFTGTDLISVKFKGEFIRGTYQLDNQTNINDWIFPYSNLIQDCTFENVKIENMRINSSVIKNTIFGTSNSYTNFKITHSKLYSNLFNGATLGIKDHTLNEKIKKFEKTPHYKKARDDNVSEKYIKPQGYSFVKTLGDIRSENYFKEILYKKSKKEKAIQIEYLKSLQKDLIFNSVDLKGTIFQNTTFQNALFINTDFSDVAFINTKFINCTFKFTDKYITSNDLSFLEAANIDNNSKIIYGKKIVNIKLPEYNQKKELRYNEKIQKFIINERKKIVCDNINSQANVLQQLHDLHLKNYFEEMQLFINKKCKKS